jgi:hypothetical protein
MLSSSNSSMLVPSGYPSKNNEQEYTPSNKVHGFLILLICAFLPFQIFGIPIGTTTFDISNIIILLLVISLLLKSNKENNLLHISSFFIFFIIQLFIFSFNETGIFRFLSAALWIFSYIIIFIRSDIIYIPTKYTYVVTIWVTTLLFLVIAFQLLIDGGSRPRGFMAEPSSAGLVLLAAAAGLILASRKAPGRFEKYVMLLMSVFFVFITYLIRSTHLVSFAFSLFLLISFSKTFDFRTTILSSIITIFIFIFALQDQHFQERLDLGPANSNLSVLSWLQGFDQMMESIKAFPLLGAGLGSTGYFYFESYNSSMLYEMGMGDLNRFDAYSGLFRMVIELGPIFAVLFFVSVARRFVKLWQNTGSGVLPVCNDTKYQLFLFAFAFTLIVGILLKEPTWSRSQAAVAVLLFYAVPLHTTRVKQGPQGQSVAHISNS